MSVGSPPVTSSLRYIKGIGPKRALALEKLGIQSVRDLFYFFPRRYEDRSSFRKISEAVLGETSTFRAEILKVTFKPIRRLNLLEVMVGDDTGTITAVWFNQPYLKSQFAAGQEIILYGRVDLYKNRIQISSPEYEVVDPEEEAIHTGRITPIYPLTEGLFQRTLRSVLKSLVENDLSQNIKEWLPVSFRNQNALMELPEAIREMHFPSSFDKQSAARRRIVFDEFLIFELMLLRKVEKLKTQHRAFTLEKGESLYKDFLSKLPFSLTDSQDVALKSLIHDLKRPFPMNRLLQGDVGSGKTVVAAFALLLAAENKRQGVLLVPTEILAEQHSRTLRDLFEPFNISIGLLTASTPAPKREKMLAELRQGKLLAVVGTHALLQEDVGFASLAVVIIDEQHKFGVYQRCRLLQGEPRPHQLVMTATPIPRTLALTLYGGLEISVMKELPAGRKPIKTYWIKREKQPEVLLHILKKIQEGDQAYFIFPLIEETEKLDLLAAKQEFERLQKGAFAKVRMGLVHGKVPNEERDAIMKSFMQGDIKILVATSVIEVGVNNPNATLIVIENAERFGLSQLHQMRGRIGRGEKPSECFLFGEPKTTEGQKRLRILTKTQDGFVIAEEDLKLRGPGDFWGTRQSGEVFFRLAHPVLDQDLLLEARKTAEEIIHDLHLEEPVDQQTSKTGASAKASIWKETMNYLEQFPLRY